MSYTIFVHRANVCDLLLYSENPYKHAVSIFKKLAANAINNQATVLKYIAEEPDEESIDGFVVASIPGLSISLHGEDFSPIGYNARGTAIVDKITNLDENGEPRGFIPYESEIPTDLTTKNVEDLDTELAEYFEEGERSTVTNLTEQAFKHYSIHFKMDKWTKAHADSQLCGSIKEEISHWSRVVYDQEHEMDWEPY